MVISKKTIIFQGFRGGGPTFSGGRGSKCYTFLKKTIKYVIFQRAPEPLPKSKLFVDLSQNL